MQHVGFTDVNEIAVSIPQIFAGRRQQTTAAIHNDDGSKVDLFHLRQCAFNAPGKNTHSKNVVIITKYRNSINQGRVSLLVVTHTADRLFVLDGLTDR